MSLNVSRLAASIKSNIESQAAAPAQDPAELLKFCTALATAIVTEITGNAVVTASGPDPQGGTQNVTGTVA